MPFQAHQKECFFQLRWILLILINVLRPQFCLFFAYYSSISLQGLLQAILISMLLLIFMLLSLKTYLSFNNRDGSVGVSVLAQRRQGRWLFPLLAAALIFSLLSPTSFFHYCHPFILLLCTWPSIQTFLHHLLPSHHYPWLRRLFNTQFPRPTLPESSLHYYELRWLLLFLINRFLRPYLAFFFSNYPYNLLVKYSIIISTITLAYLSISLKICLTPNANNGSFLLILLRLGLRDGWSVLITSAFLLSLLCPNPVFLYLYPCILFLTLWPSFSLNFLRGLSAVVTDGILYLITPITNPEEQQNGEEDPTSIV